MTSPAYRRAADSLTSASTAIDTHIASFLTLLEIVKVRQGVLMEKVNEISGENIIQAREWFDSKFGW